jgi:hypothetical protein
MLPGRFIGKRQIEKNDRWPYLFIWTGGLSQQKKTVDESLFFFIVLVIKF